MDAVTVKNHVMQTKEGKKKNTTTKCCCVIAINKGHKAGQTKPLREIKVSLKSHLHFYSL